MTARLAPCSAGPCKTLWQQVRPGEYRWRGTPQPRLWACSMPETAATTTTIPHEGDIVAALGGRSVVLVGMMGAGKSTIGRRLAARIRLPFLDADAEIEAAAGMSIPDIFETHGGPHLRDGEARGTARP